MRFQTVFIRATYILVLILLIAASLGITVLLKSKQSIFEQVVVVYPSGQAATTSTVTPFPVGVNSLTEEIIEDPTVESFFYESLANAPDSQKYWWNQVASVLSTKSWFQNLASPISRILIIWPGDRKEEIAENFATILRWSRADKQEFLALMAAREPFLSEGTFYPGQYVAHRHATPADIAGMIDERFSAEILARYPSEVEKQVPLEDALIVASLLEREARDFVDMREISGIIWNRLFIDMPLQLDATLQYARGSRSYEPKWWPVPKPADKYIDSPFNTYQNLGLPPAPIANPSPEAILAALNPRETECLYYFHDDNRNFHCSKDYPGHVAKLRSIFGQGR